MAIHFMESKTKENLMKAFAGESQARNRYTMAAEKADELKMQAVRNVFLFTADQERAHAQRFYELLGEAQGTTIDICGGYPVDKSDTLVDLLQAAVHNEMEEYEDVYQAFGDTAKEEGFMKIASAFYRTAEVEFTHAKRFGKILELIKSGKYFESEATGMWMCLNCGYIYTGKKVPDVCPLCRHDKGYFIPLCLAPYTCSDITDGRKACYKQ